MAPGLGAVLLVFAAACSQAAHSDASELGEEPQAVVSTCEERAQGIAARFAALDRGCSSNEDCGIAQVPPSCPISACGSVVSRAHQSDIEPIDDELCTDFAADGCLPDMAQPDCTKRGPVACIDDRCVDCSVESCAQTSCDRCTLPYISWSPMVADGSITYSISDCSKLSVSESVNKFLSSETAWSASCSTSLPCIVAHDGNLPTSSVADLQNTFGDPEFQAAIASGNRVSVSGIRMTVQVGSLQIDDCSLFGGVSCSPAPASVAAFVRMLQDIAQRHACTPGT